MITWRNIDKMAHLIGVKEFTSNRITCEALNETPEGFATVILYGLKEKEASRLSEHFNFSPFGDVAVINASEQ